MLYRIALHLHTLTKEKRYDNATQFYKALKNPKKNFYIKTPQKNLQNIFTKAKKIPKGSNSILPQIPTFT